MRHGFDLRSVALLSKWFWMEGLKASMLDAWARGLTIFADVAPEVKMYAPCNRVRIVEREGESVRRTVCGISYGTKFFGGLYCEPRGAPG